jgi:hypothetical protein
MPTDLHELTEICRVKISGAIRGRMRMSKKKQEAVGEKMMLRYNIKVVAFISVFLLFFAVSVYGPSVYAKMKVMEDDYLSQVEGEAGVSMDLNVTVRVVSDTLKISNDAGDYIQSSVFTIDNGSGGNISVTGSSNTDVGSSAGRTWLYMTTPTITNMRVYAPNLTVSSIYYTRTIDNDNISANTPSGPLPYNLGALSISGIYLGQSVATSQMTGANPVAYTAGATPYVRIGAHSGSTGIDMYSASGGYIDNVTWTYGTGATASVNVSGIYMYAANDDLDRGANVNSARLNNSSTWDTPYGNMIIGGNNVDAVNYATIDVGSNTTDGAILKISAPMSGNQRVRSFTINGKNLGPLISDNINLYTFKLTIRNLNSAGY